MFAYTRDQEREADTISLQLMGIAGYDMSQAATVWANLLAEVSAGPNADPSKSSVLFATHPASDERRDALERLGKAGGERAGQAYRNRMATLELDFLEDEMKRGQYEETITMLDRKLKDQPQRGDYIYCRAEARRLRGKDEDLAQAEQELGAAVDMKNTPPQAHRSLGLLLRAKQDKAAAAAAFSRYLELAPAAPDAGIIKVYISELRT
jgi:predicted Zn-dependent protease